MTEVPMEARGAKRRAVDNSNEKTLRATALASMKSKSKPAGSASSSSVSAASGLSIDFGADLPSLERDSKTHMPPTTESFVFNPTTVAIRPATAAAASPAVAGGPGRAIDIKPKLEPVVVAHQPNMDNETQAILKSAKTKQERAAEKHALKTLDMSDMLKAIEELVTRFEKIKKMKGGLAVVQAGNLIVGTKSSFSGALLPITETIQKYENIQMTAYNPDEFFVVLSSLSGVNHGKEFTVKTRYNEEFMEKKKALIPEPLIVHMYHASREITQHSEGRIKRSHTVSVRIEVFLALFPMKVGLNLIQKFKDKHLSSGNKYIWACQNKVTGHVEYFVSVDLFFCGAVSVWNWTLVCGSIGKSEKIEPKSESPRDRAIQAALTLTNLFRQVRENISIEDFMAVERLIPERL